MLEKYEDVLSIEDVSTILGIGKNWVYRLLTEEKISAFKIGRNWKIPKSNLIDYITHQSKPTKP